MSLSYFENWMYTRDQDNAGKAGYSFRTIIPTSAIINSGSAIKVILHSGSAEALVVSHCSIGEYAGSGYDTTGTPTPITFDTGAAGCTVTADGIKPSDGIVFGYDVTKQYVITIDVEAAQTDDTLAQFDGRTGFDCGYKAATESYNQATVSGFSSMTAGSFVGIKSLQVGADIDANTVLLLHADGADGSTSFTDFSPVNHTATANGDAQVDDAQGVFGPSLRLDGTGDYLSIPQHSSLSFGTGDWTIQFRLRLNSSLPSYAGFLSASYSGAADDTWLLGYYSGAIQLSNGSTGFSYSWSPSTATWYAIAVVKSGNNLLLFIDGVLVQTSTGFSAVSFNCGSSGLVIGRLYAGPYDNYYIDGWMDEIRISDTARYTTDYDLETAEFGYADTPTNPTYTAKDIGTSIIRTSFLADDIGAFRLGYGAYTAEDIGRSAILAPWSGRDRGNHRQAETLDEWLLFESVDGAAFDFTTPTDANGTGVFVRDLPASHTYRHLVRRRNQHGLTSQNEDNYVETIVDATGNADDTPPSAPYDVAATAVASGVVRVSAAYAYPFDGSNAADNWEVWYTTDGSDPVASGTPDYSPATIEADGVARLSLNLPAQSHGTTVKAIVGMIRDTFRSEPSSVVSTTADAVGPDAPDAQAFFGAIVAAYEE